MNPNKETNPVISQARALISEGRVAEALSTLDGHLVQVPGDQDVAFARVRLLGDFFPANFSLAASEQYCITYPDDRNGTALVAWNLMKAGRTKDSLRRLEESENTTGLSWDGRRLKIGALIRKGRIEEARKLADEQDKDSGPSIAAIENLVELNGVKDESQMQDVASQLRELGKQPEKVDLFAAKWYLEHSFQAKAEAVIEVALSRNPNDPNLNHFMAKLELLANREEAVVARMKKIIARNPADERAARWLGTYYLGKFRFLDFHRTVRAYVAALRSLNLIRRRS